jgi:predicted nucleic acid-binding protein
MGAVALDAGVLIAFLEPTDALHADATRMLAPHLGPGGEVVLGASVYAEVLVRPMSLGHPDVVDRFLADARIRVLPVDRGPARRAAALRAEHRGLRLPDALALASALEVGAHLLTLDLRLGRLVEALG